MRPECDEEVLNKARRDFTVKPERVLWARKYLMRPESSVGSARRNPKRFRSVPIYFLLVCHSGVTHKDDVHGSTSVTEDMGVVSDCGE